MNCTSANFFTQSNQPLGLEGVSEYNPQATTHFFAPDFKVTEENTYTSYDPRLVSNQHNGQRLTLNTPPVDHSVKMRDVYNKRLFQTGYYQNYNDVTAGDITYYIDSSIATPLYLPVYASTAQVTGYNYVDPMGSGKPHYLRTPLTHCNPILDKQWKTMYADGLSSISDTNEFREDLINKQQQATLQQSYVARWH